MLNRCLVFAILSCIFCGCASSDEDSAASSCRYARYFDIVECGTAESDSCRKGIVLLSPFGEERDTVFVDVPMERIICMSSSHVAGLSAIGAGSSIVGVSGVKYLYHERNVSDVGYEASLDYEAILSLKPDVVLAYTVSGAVPQYIKKLRDLGIPVMILHDHLENHPLARAEYMRLYGVLTHRSEEADSVFASVSDAYESLASGPCQDKPAVKVLINIPYGDMWYIPGDEGYMSQMIRDAGGVVLGARKGTAGSSSVSLERAYEIAAEADLWLNPGYCRSREELAGVHHLFPSFGPLAKGLPIYNNTLRCGSEGGNDFWETGAVRPDLILRDLVNIFNGSYSEESGTFFRLLPDDR